MKFISDPRSSGLVARGAALLAAAACGLPAHATLAQWTAEAASGSPATVVKTHVFTPSIVDIGSLGGDITYEFVVNGADRAAAGSLVGSLQGGQAQAIRFEQWFDTGSYGATQYRVGDYQFGVSTRYDTDIVLAFVVDAGAGTTRLFVDGVDSGATVPLALTLHGQVAFGGTLLEDGSFLGDDAFAGTVLGFAAYDTALGAAELAVHAAAFHASAVPEPATALLSGLALVALARRPRRARRERSRA